MYGIVHHCTPDELVVTAGQTLGDSVRVNVNPPYGFSCGAGAPLAQWMSIRIRSRASLAFCCACARRIVPASALSPAANDVVSPLRTTPMITRTVRSSKSVYPASSRKRERTRRQARESRK